MPPEENQEETEGVTWGGTLITWAEVTRRIELADCGRCWPGSANECHIPLMSLQQGEKYVVLRGTSTYVHQDRIARAIRTGMIPSADGITLGTWTVHPLECRHWATGKDSVRPGQKLHCDQCKAEAGVVPRPTSLMLERK